MFDLLSQIFMSEPPREIIDVEYEDITGQIEPQNEIEDRED